MCVECSGLKQRRKLNVLHKVYFLIVYFLRAASVRLVTTNSSSVFLFVREEEEEEEEVEEVVVVDAEGGVDLAGSFNFPGFFRVRLTTEVFSLRRSSFAEVPD